MSAADRKLRDREKARAYRARMRAKGLRPVQRWAPDTRSPEFVERARRECAALRNDSSEAEILDDIEAFAVDLLNDVRR
jgi:hypothetical protein